MAGRWRSLWRMGGECLMLSKNLISTVTPIGGEDYWIATLGGTGDDYGYGIAVDASGNVYVTGFTASQGAGGNDVLITKYDTSGAIQWQRSLGDANSDFSRGIAVDDSGNVYVVGQTSSQSNDVLIAKYNTSGTIQWQRSLGGAGSDGGFAIAVDASGNVYVGGQTSSQGAGGADALIVKYNTSGTIQWQRRLGGANADYCNSIAVDASGNVYAAGYTLSQGAGGVDVLIVKYNTSGVIQWQRSLGGANADYSFGIAVDVSSNVYVTGYTNSQGAGNFDALIAKYDTSGTLQWQRSLGGTSNEEGKSITVDASGNVYVTGYTQVSGINDVLIVKYDTSGTLQWQRRLGGAGSDGGFAIAVDASGNVYVTGSTNSQGAGSFDALIAKLPGDGSLTGSYGNLTYAATTLTDSARTLTSATATLTEAATTLTSATTTLTDAATTLTSTTAIIPVAYWIATLGGAGGDFGRSVAVDTNGNVYITGTTTSQGAGSNDGLIIKYNAHGVIQWQRSLGGADLDVVYGIGIDASSNVYVAGFTISQGAGSYDVLIAKYNSSGTIQWQRTLGGTNADIGQGITVDASGNVYVTGYTFSQGAGSADVLIAKYDTDGTIQWQRCLGGADIDIGYGIAVDDSGNVYVAGYTTSQTAGLDDVLIVKYNASGTIQWQRRLGGASVDMGYGISVDSSGNVYVTGYTQSQTSGVQDVLVAKYNTSGVIQWQRGLGGAGNDQGTGIAVDASGNVYVTGQTTSQGAGGNDAIVTKYNTSGGIIWQRRLGGTAEESGAGLEVDDNGNVYVTGYTGSQGSGGNDLFIAKLPASGGLTGTYGNLTYGVMTLSSATTTLTDAATTLTSATTTLTSTAATLTDAATTLTSSTTTIQTGA